MLRGLTILLGCQFAGEAISILFHLPLPGPVTGMLILLAVLVARGTVPDDVGEASGGLLRNFGYLFVPAGVGIVTQLDVLGRNWAAIAVALLISTLLGLGVTALLARWLLIHGTLAPVGDPPP